MSVFLFEYATCGAFRELEPSITVEGLAMFKTLLEGFNESKKQVNTFIDKRIDGFPEYPRVDVDIQNDLFSKYLDDSDFFLGIAPEPDLELYNMTKEAERHSCINLGSSSKAVKITSDKYETYKKLKRIKKPKTEIFNVKTSLDFPVVAKPRSGVSGEGIFLIKSETDLLKASGPSESQSDYLLQEYIEGRPCSASLLVGDETKILSINTQEMDGFSYKGAKIPYRLTDPEELYRAVDKIKGLFGYVGIDFVFNGDINVIEINARPTTPIIAFKNVYGFNISKLIMDNYYKEKIPDFKAKRTVMIRKVSQNLTGLVSFKDHSIILEETDEDIDI